jgi:hypothetical protein
MTIDTSFTPLTGGCQCRKVRFRMERAPIITHCCHCRDCQRVSGSAFRINAMIETDGLTILEGTPRPSHGAASEQAVQCPDCGSSLWTHHPELGETLAFVGVGMLDHGERLPPEAHYFTRSKHPWLALPPELPTFEAMGYPDKPGARTRIESALARQAERPSG